MPLVHYGEVVEIGARHIKAVEIIETATGRRLGYYTGCVGPHGTSTGIFRHCETTCPFEELKLYLRKL